MATPRATCQTSTPGEATEAEASSRPQGLQANEVTGDDPLARRKVIHDAPVPLPLSKRGHKLVEKPPWRKGCHTWGERQEPALPRSLAVDVPRAETLLNDPFAQSALPLSSPPPFSFPSHCLHAPPTLFPFRFLLSCHSYWSAIPLAFFETQQQNNEGLGLRSPLLPLPAPEFSMLPRPRIQEERSHLCPAVFPAGPPLIFQRQMPRRQPTASILPQGGRHSTAPT